MNLRKLLFTTLIGSGMFFSAQAQEQPEHPMYVLFGTEKPINEYFEEWVTNWEKGIPLTEDDNFFISRVKPKQRFADKRTQVNDQLTTDRKIAWWCPIGESTKQWGPLPRYNFNADVFSMWQYIDVHANWSNFWFRVPGAFSDVARKNGVQGGCLKFVDWAASITPNTSDGKIFDKISEQNSDGTFKYAEKLVRMLHYYGIDGIGVNPEGTWTASLAYKFQDFLAQCHIEARKLGYPFRVDWYDSNDNAGSLGFRSNQLDSSNKDWFIHPELTHADGTPANVTDVFMINYNWYTSQLTNSAANAKAYGRSPYDVYAGIDLEGRGWNGSGGWQLLGSKESSVIFWGHHARNMLFGSSYEFGGTDISVQKTYQEKQEMAFTGGSRNPANTPALINQRISNSHADLAKFNGISKLIPARSTLSELPFITRFNLGNGLSFKLNGKTTFDKKWYNIGMQDYLPSWRWWIVDDAGNVPADQIKCEFSFDDAWFGGNCLKLSGATRKSNIRMFKTKFDAVPNGSDLIVRYRVENGVKTHLNLLWTEDGSTWHSTPIPDAKIAGEWSVYQAKVNTLGMNGKNIAAIGFAVDNTDANYEVLLGEFAIIPRKTYAPATPTITKATYLERRFNEADFKLIFKSKDSDDPTLPVYNEDVDTWYFEVYSQAEGSDPVLCTATTSWASYVVGAPVLASSPKVRFGVRAVAPDGKTFSNFAWTDYFEKEMTPVETIEIDKSVIKPNEEFTVRYADPYHVAAKWEIIDPITSNVLQSANDAKSITSQLPNIGVYDLRITCNGEVIFTRGAITISPMEVGALPIIETLTTDKETAMQNENIKAEYIINRLGEGFASKALRVEDPYLFRVPADDMVKNNSYSVAMWFKSDEFNMGLRGIALLNRCDRFFEGSPWMATTRGDFWVQILAQEDSDAPNWNHGEISYTCYGMTQSGYSELEKWGNPWEIPSKPMVSQGYSVVPGQWTHLVISHDKATSKMRIFFNGKLVKEGNVPFSIHKGGPIYVGLSHNMRTSFCGEVDEFQVWDKALATEAEVGEAMKGYQTAPANLLAYYTFEEKTVNNHFANKGTLGGDATYNGRLVIIDEDNKAEPTQEANNNYLGCPIISGTLPVVTTAKWFAEGAAMTTSDKTANISFPNVGEEKIAVALENNWGTSVKHEKTITITIDPTSIDDINNTNQFTYYPNPFIEQVNIVFGIEGAYEVKTFNTAGQLISSSAYQVEQGETKQLSFDQGKGNYFVTILKDGQVVKSFKITKQ